MTRYPNTFKVRGGSSPSIVTLGVMPRSLARSQALALAAWLVAFVGDLPTFARILLDVWVSRYGLAQTPEWLRALSPEWSPYEPPPRPVAAPNPVGSQPIMPVPISHAPAPPASNGVATPTAAGSSGPSRFTLADGTPLDAERVRSIADEAARTLAGGGSPKPLPAPLPVPLPLSENEGENGGGEHG